MKKEKIIIILFILLFSLLQINLIINFGNNLVSYDPHYHRAISDQIANEGMNANYISNAAIIIEPIYHSSLHTFSAIFSLITGITIFNQYKFMSAIILGITSIIIYLFSRKITNSKLISLLTVLTFLSSNYILTRFRMNLPENFAILFLALLIFILVLKPNKYLIVITLISYMFYHFRSIVIPLILILSYALVNYKQYLNKKSIKNIILATVAILVITIPVLIPAIKSYLFLFLEYINIIPDWSTVAANPALREPLNMDRILGLTGAPFIFLFLLGLIGIKKIKGAKNRKLVISCSITSTLIAILMFIPGIYNNVPPDRFIIYAIVISMPIIATGLLLISNQKLRKPILFILILLFITIFIVENGKDHGWAGIKKVDFDTIDFINSNYSNNIKVTYGSPYYTFLENAEWHPAYPLGLFREKSIKGFQNSLIERYGPNKTIIIAISYDGFGLIKKSNPKFFEYIEKFKIYEKGRTEVYKVQI